MERIVNEDMSWLSEADQRKILTPLMLMRRYEVEYRLTRADPVDSLFKDELAKFEKAFAAIVAAAIMKQQLNDQVKTYTDAFARMDREHRQDRARASRSSRPRRARCCPPPTRSSPSAGRKAAAAAERRRGLAGADQAADHRRSASRSSASDCCSTG